ncbi:Protein of unknown function DUF761 [Macleaya cordata]|uniref:DUF761 domain-containing protein n=1 Tax=Macleaya cordata TaxID=56857 RepID=A0A200QHV5_MACCD|nr:Protein of unknown function DUF761 [Macleaya cordata]
MNRNNFKSPLYNPRAVDHHHQEHPRPQRKNADVRLDRPTARAKKIEINATKDINESAEAFIERFRQQQEPPRAPERNIIVQGDQTAAAERKMIESKASIEDINESAEAFIKRFRQQLQIQRLESIENYEKMLARGL